jgi:hypothetical protein
VTRTGSSLLRLPHPSPHVQAVEMEYWRGRQRSEQPCEQQDRLRDPCHEEPVVHDKVLSRDTAGAVACRPEEAFRNFLRLHDTAYESTLDHMPDDSMRLVDGQARSEPTTTSSSTAWDRFTSIICSALPTIAPCSVVPAALALAAPGSSASPPLPIRQRVHWRSQDDDRGSGSKLWHA